VLAVRVTDRIGKGIRTAPRDVLISNAVPSDQAGRAFGLHRAMDHAGAVVGPLVATLLLSLGLSLREVFLAAVVPGVLTLVAVALVREGGERAVEAPVAQQTPAGSQTKARLPRSFYGYLAILALFALGNSSDAFLLLRAAELGVPTALLPMLWVALHVSKLVFTYLGGALADRFSRPRLVIAGWIVFSLSYLGLGYATHSSQVWSLFLLYGLYYGLTEPTERALVKDLAPRELQGRAFGLYNFVLGVSAVPAGLLTGFVWQSVSPEAALMLGAAIAATASLALAGFAPAWRR
jgi:MFS-type transporter involved in bile tolerance (Atg22 family)